MEVRAGLWHSYCKRRDNTFLSWTCRAGRQILGLASCNGRGASFGARGSAVRFAGCHLPARLRFPGQAGDNEVVEERKGENNQDRQHRQNNQDCQNKKHRQNKRYREGGPCCVSALRVEVVCGCEGDRNAGLMICPTCGELAFRLGLRVKFRLPVLSVLVPTNYAKYVSRLEITPVAF